MAYFLFKCWHEQLFFAERERAVPGVTDLPVTLVPITEENAALVRDLRGARFEEQFRYQLSLGDFGYYACLDGKPIGYGWAKHAGSDDYFFKIRGNDASVRGLCKVGFTPVGEYGFLRGFKKTFNKKTLRQNLNA